MCNDNNIQKSRSKAKPLKSSKRYVDAPRFKAIYGYEDDFKNNFKKYLVDAQKEIILRMSKMKV